MKRAVVACLVLAGLLLATVGVGAQSVGDAWIPGVASFLLPGLGQLINDEMDKALIHFGIDLAIIGLGVYLGRLLPFGFYTIPALHLAWGVYSGLDAYDVAKEQGFTLGLRNKVVLFSYEF